MHNSPITYGFDVEFPLVSQDTVHEEIVPAHLYISNGKSDPLPLGGDGAVGHHDNVALEIATKVYTMAPGDQVPWHSIANGIEGLAHYVLNLSPLAGPPPKLSYRATARITGAMEDQYPELTVFGCDPDYNAYTGKKNPSPSPSAAAGLRSFSGHMHVGFLDPEAAGFDPSCKEHYHALAKSMDVFVGYTLWSYRCLDPLRMTLYGRPGAFRYKKEYPGIEYRVPSNEWLQTHKAMDLPGGMLSHATQAWSLFLEDEFDNLAREVEKAINEDNRGVREYLDPIIGSLQKSLKC